MKTNPNRVNRLLKSSRSLQSTPLVSSPASSPESPEVNTEVKKTGKRPGIYLQKGKVRLFNEGNPLIYQTAINTEARCVLLTLVVCVVYFECV